METQASVNLNFRKEKKMKYLKNKWLWATLICFALMFYIMDLVYQHRGYFGVGGEIFIPAMPLIVWVLLGIVREE